MEGVILSETTTTAYVKGIADQKTYIFNSIDQVNPGFFLITQGTEPV